MVPVFSSESTSCGPQHLPHQTLITPSIFPQSLPGDQTPGRNCLDIQSSIRDLSASICPCRPCWLLAPSIRVLPQIPRFTQPLPSKANRGSSFSHRPLNLTSGLRICPQSLSGFQHPQLGFQLRRTPTSLSVVPSHNGSNSPSE